MIRPASFGTTTDASYTSHKIQLSKAWQSVAQRERKARTRLGYILATSTTLNVALATYIVFGR